MLVYQRVYATDVSFEATVFPRSRWAPARSFSSRGPSGAYVPSRRIRMVPTFLVPSDGSNVF